MSDFLYAGLGLVILLLSGDALVKGAVNTALRLGIPALIVSLTIVAFGTSAPELLIAIQSIDEGLPGLAMGNVVGSNTANVLMVLGIPAIVAGFGTGETDVRKSYVTMLGATAVFIVMCFFGPITWTHGIVLLGVLSFVLWGQAQDALRHRKAGKQAAAEAELEDLEGLDPSLRWWKILMFLALGMIGLPLGADVLVDAAEDIASDYGVSDRIIGLTLVAIGTSLPELSTTIMAALRKQADVALGNVIGSNIFNLLAIIGVAALFGNIPVDPGILRFDLWVMVGASLILAPFVFSSKLNLTRPWGILLSAAYVIYIIKVIV